MRILSTETTQTMGHEKENIKYNTIQLHLYTTSCIDCNETVVGVDCTMYSRLILDFTNMDDLIDFLGLINVDRMSETEVSCEARLRYYYRGKLQFEEQITLGEEL